MPKGYPVEGTDRLSLDTISIIRAVYPKTKVFYNRHLKGGDVTLPTLYRALDLEPVSIKTVRIIEDVVSSLRTRHSLDNDKLFQALDTATSLLEYVPKALGDDPKAGKYRQVLLPGVEAFLSEYNKSVEELNK